MKTTLLIFIVAMSVSNAFPAGDDKPKPEIVKSEYVNNGDKGYNFE
jgi:hypothetical protein